MGGFAPQTPQRYFWSERDRGRRVERAWDAWVRGAVRSVSGGAVHEMQERLSGLAAADILGDDARGAVGAGF